MIPLFKQFPRLADQLPCAPIATIPTPVRPCDGLADYAGAASLHVKCDDQTGSAYGGNKVRKLAFLLGRARQLGATSTLTFGAAGSNHALATAIYARQLGMQPISMLVPQVNVRKVGTNLLRYLPTGATLHHFNNRLEVARGTVDIVCEAHRRGDLRPVIIPAGGSSPLGTVGYVNAALELKAQIVAGDLPTPEVIYVASGTMGTCVGLLLGLQLGGLDTTVMAVRVTTDPFTSLEKARRLYARTLGLLRKADPAVPPLAFPEGHFVLRDGYLGTGYGVLTEAGVAAVETAGRLAQLGLEGTYTGKTMACLLGDGRDGLLAGKSVLFWNTYNSVSQEEQIKLLDYHQLPRPFHRYYEEAVQKLDRCD